MLAELPNADLSEKQAIVEVSKRIPKRVVCLLSALAIHEITTQSPFEVWIAINTKARRSQINNLPVRFMRYSEESLTSGIDYHLIDGLNVPVFNPARTIADCFKSSTWPLPCVPLR